MTKSKGTSQKVSQHTLVQGSYFALHTAGCQARSASILFDADEHATARLADSFSEAKTPEFLGAFLVP